MKFLKKMLRLCALILFMLLAAVGIGIFGLAPTLIKNRKLFADIEATSEVAENDTSSSDQSSLTDTSRFKNR